MESVSNDDEEDGPSGAARHRSPSIVNAIGNQIIFILKLSKVTFSTLIVSQQFTLAVIRPDAYAEGKVNEVIDAVGFIYYL